MPRRRRRLTVACVAVLAASASSYDAAADDASQNRGWTLRIDDDFLALAGRDADYTGGIAYALHDDGRRGPRWLAGALTSIDDALRVPRAGSPVEPRRVRGRRAVLHAARLDGRAGVARRPSVRESRLRLDARRSRATRTARSFGRRPSRSACLGLPIIGDLHRCAARAVRSPLPNGYAHQISDGGEPTFRYTFSSRQLLASGTHGRAAVLGALWLSPRTRAT